MTKGGTAHLIPIISPNYSISSKGKDHSSYPTEKYLFRKMTSSSSTQIPNTRKNQMKKTPSSISHSAATACRSHCQRRKKAVPPFAHLPIKNDNGIFYSIGTDCSMKYSMVMKPMNSTVRTSWKF